MELQLADAKKIIQATLAAQASHSFKPMAVVVVGARGSMIAAECQDGTSLLRPKIAHGKAYGAIAMGVGSRVLFERAKNEPFFVQSVNALSDGALVPVPGGVLVRDTGGNIVGAVGVTGDLSDNDEICAVTGIEAAGFVADTGA